MRLSPEKRAALRAGLAEVEQQYRRLSEALDRLGFNGERRVWLAAKSCGLSLEQYGALGSLELVRLFEAKAEVLDLVKESELRLTSEYKRQIGASGGRPKGISTTNGSAVRELRLAVDYTQPRLARALKVSPDTIQRAECGRSSPKTIRKLKEFAKKHLLPFNP